MSVVSFFVLLGVIEASALHWDCFVNSSTQRRWTLPGVRTETKRLRPPTGNWRVDLCGTMSFVSSICRINHPRLSWRSRVRVGARQRKWAASDRNLSLIESSHSHRHPSSFFFSRLCHSVAWIWSVVVFKWHNVSFSGTSVHLRRVTLTPHMIWIVHIRGVTAELELQRVFVWKRRVLHRRAQQQPYIMFHTTT